MGRTMLVALIGVAVVGAVAVLLFISPMATAPEQAELTETTGTSEAVELEQTPPEVIGEIQTPIVPESGDEPLVLEEPTAPANPRYSIDGTIVAGEYAHEMTVAGVDVYWSNDAHQLRMGLVSPGTGYVSIGFDPDRQMEGANFILASMHEGELTIRDDFGHEPLAHVEDAMRGGEDNIITAAGNEWPDQTVVEFIIPLDSGDPMDKPLTPGHQYTVLVAYHSLLDSFSSRHTRRGSGQLQLDVPS